MTLNTEDLRLIRHIAGKALVESDELDVTEYDADEIELALWATAAEASHGLYLSHPSEMYDE